MEKTAIRNPVPYFMKHVKGMDTKKALKGYRAAATEGGPESFIAAIPNMIAGKVFGKKKVDDFMWNYVNKPATNVDTYIGSKLRKIPVIGKAFVSKDALNTGKNVTHTVERSSATAPLVKVRNIAVPIVAGIGIEKGISDIAKKIKGDTTGNPQQENDNMNDSDLNKVAELLEPELREKVASKMLQLHSVNKEHEKRAYATKVLYKQAELGFSPFPHTYHEYEQKLASLMSQDLAVVEKAMELASGDVKIGELTGSEPYSQNAEATFQAEILGY